MAESRNGVVHFGPWQVCLSLVVGWRLVVGPQVAAGLAVVRGVERLVVESLGQLVVLRPLLVERPLAVVFLLVVRLVVPLGLCQLVVGVSLVDPQKHQRLGLMLVVDEGLECFLVGVVRQRVVVVDS